MPRQKLELTWIGKDERPRLEPRILVEDPALSYHAAANVTGNDIYDNRLIFGDNLLALKALEQEFAGKVKCIFIDPPYNTGTAFEHYDDGIEHSLWLSMIRDRLELLRRLLSTTGTIWVTLDDTEAHYFKVVADEVFGRANFLGNVIWEKSDSPRMDAEFFSVRHDHLFVYARDAEMATWNRLPQPTEAGNHYDKVDSRGHRYYLKPLRAMGGQGDSRAARPNLYYALTAPDGTEVFPRRQDGSDGAWRWSRQKAEAEAERIEWIRGRNGWSVYYRIYEDESATRPPETIWKHEEVGSNRTSKSEIKALFPTLEPFATPKPERLIERVIAVASNAGDLVVDSFAGSGTTGAVAHKMGRRWIMIELGEHANTHIVPRLRKVIDGDDPGGITESVNWKGGGGFRYFRLAPSLLEKDRWGNWVISKQYNAAMLAEAMCKHEGFTYAPSADVFWQQGQSSERDYIYVTTQTLTAQQLSVLSEEVGADRTLLVCCSAWRGGADRWRNLTLKKIPATVRDRCEFGRDDYSLQVANLPVLEPADAIDAGGDQRPAPRRGRRQAAASDETIDIFADAEPSTATDE
jgi:adenine-specific DNA-methyltransferase